MAGRGGYKVKRSRRENTKRRRPKPATGWEVLMGCRLQAADIVVPFGVTGKVLNEGLASGPLFRRAADIRSMIMVSARA